ncbi:enoyl-CoA hydratase/isomerase family protein [Streptomyces sp. BI20]|uniref:enoyl-CoA hydratase/isomerase family protein n=1 Tax=Streptomyces sp. BI20 TaxID=3403460 RepID=UPI003C760EAB
MDAQLHLSAAGAVATVTVSHPARRNAMTRAMWRRLPELLDRVAADPEIAVLVLTGAGDTFCAGADITDLREVETGGPEDPRVLAVRAEEALAAFPKPTLAVIRGHCVGGGCQLAVACDLRFAAEDARFGVTPARLGVVYPASTTRRLAALVGPATTKWLLYSGESMDGARALRTGLVDELLPAEALDARVAAFTATLAARSRLTQAAVKEFLAADADPAGLAAREAAWTREADRVGETAEGVAAFLDRRAPRFPWPADS